MMAAIMPNPASNWRRGFTLTQTMKNIQVIDGAENCVYDIFAASDETFGLIFKEGTDIAFAEDLPNTDAVRRATADLWRNRVPKARVNGIHGILFYQLCQKRQYYPTLRDEEATNPDGTRLR